MRRVYLMITADHIRAEYGEPLKQPIATCELRTYQQFLQFLDECNCAYVLCSSTLDHPSEMTKNRAVIRLCQRIRAFDSATREIRDWEQGNDG